MKLTNVRKLALLIALPRLVTFFAYPNPISYPDSPGYFASNRFNFDLVSLTGHSARSWPAPLLYAILPNQISVSFVQLGISGFAWFWFIWNASKLLHIRKFKYSMVIFLWVISVATPVIQWDGVLLGTSLLISTMLLVTGQFIKFINSEYKCRDYVVLISLITLLGIEKLSNAPIMFGMF